MVPCVLRSLAATKRAGFFSSVFCTPVCLVCLTWAAVSSCAHKHPWDFLHERSPSEIAWHECRQKFWGFAQPSLKGLHLSAGATQHQSCLYARRCVACAHQALWTRVTLGLGMCKVCTEAVHSVALWTRVTLGLGMCKVCTEAVHSVALWTRVTLGLGMCKVCTEAVHSVALWTRVTLGLGMCKVCTEAVHSVALWTRVTY